MEKNKRLIDFFNYDNKFTLYRGARSDGRRHSLYVATILKMSRHEPITVIYPDGSVKVYTFPYEREGWIAKVLEYKEKIYG